MMNKVKLYFSKITNYIKKLDAKKRNLYLIILGVAVTASVLSAVLLNQKDYVVLYRNLDTKECAAIVKRLDELKISSKVENGSTIYVEKKDEPKVKLQLASEGYPKSSLNYDIFTQNINLMTTDYEKTKYNLFLLQERLQGSIKTLENVKDAIVTISIPDNSTAVLDKDKIPPSASVVLNLVNGVTLTEKQIKGIELLVSKSVPGLTSKNVSLIDQSGKILNDSSSDGLLVSTSDRVKTENDISNMLVNRITSVLEPIYGKSNISVGVSVSLDYSKKLTEKTEYSPSNGNTSLINNYRQSYEGSASGAAAASGIPGTSSNSTIPGYQVPTDNDNNQNVKNDVNVQFFVNQVKEQVQKEGADIKDITVSVLINKKDMPADEAERITKIIANTSGIAKEKVELLSTEFTKANSKVVVEAAPKNNLLSLLSPKYLIIAGAALLLLLVLLFVFLKLRRKKHRALESIVATGEIEPEKDIMAEFAKITETKEQQLTREIREFSIKTPQITAQLIRTLLKGEID